MFKKMFGSVKEVNKLDKSHAKWNFLVNQQVPPVAFPCRKERLFVETEIPLRRGYSRLL